MSFLGKLDQHSDLMQRMADTQHADLGDALLQGRATGEDLRSAVLRCMACDSVEQCEDWLDQPRAEAESPAVPDYCRNRDFLDRIVD